MGAFAWEVVGSVAGVVGAAAAIVFGVFPLLQRRKEILALPGQAGQEALPTGAGNGGPAVVGEIPQEPLGFQPRTDLLAALDAAEPDSRGVVVHAVTGMRGVGKTHLAAAYARAKLAERWRLVAWINAGDLGAVLAGLAATADSLGLGASAEDAAAAGRAVRHWLEIDGNRCLLVFDNASDPEVLQPFIPAVGNAWVIITSNQRSTAHLGRAVLVGVFSEPEALNFLAGRTGLADAGDARALAAELGYLPLALAQAAAVIADQHLSYGIYLQRLRSMRVDQVLTRVEAGQYPRGVAAAVLLSLEGVRAGDDAGLGMAVLELLAVLSSAGVRRTLLQEAARHGVLGRNRQAGELAADAVDRVLARLAGASLLTFSVDDSTVSLHRLVMRVAREQLAADGSLVTVCVAAAQLLDGLAESLRPAWHQDRAAARDLVEQIMALSESSAGCPADRALDSMLLRLRGQAVWFMAHLRDSPSQSILVAEALLADRERVLGAGHPDTMTARHALAEAYQVARQPEKAIIPHEQNLADRERLLGAGHPGTLASRSDLAAAYQETGRTDQAITLYEHTLADLKRILGADHPNTLTLRNNLAGAYLDAGRTEEAITLLEGTLADLKRLLGPDHPDTLRTRTNLAAAYRESGRADEAIALYEQILPDLERVLGADHPDTVRARSSLAAAHRSRPQGAKQPPRLGVARWRKPKPGQPPAP